MRHESCLKGSQKGRVQVMMRKQQAADACIDALQRKRTHAKTPASVGTILKAPKSFQALAALNEEGSKDRAEPGSVTPKVRFFCCFHVFLHGLDLACRQTTAMLSQWLYFVSEQRATIILDLQAENLLLHLRQDQGWRAECKELCPFKVLAHAYRLKQEQGAIVCQSFRTSTQHCKL